MKVRTYHEKNYSNSSTNGNDFNFFLRLYK